MAVSLLLLAQAIHQPLWGQACRGLPVERHGWLGIRSGVVSGGSLLGGEAGWRILRSSSAFAEIGRIQFRGDEIPETSFAVGAALHLPGAIGVPWCLTASGRVSRYGDLQEVTIPLGITLGTVLRLGESSWRLWPHVEPRVAYRQASVEGFRRVSFPASFTGGMLISRNQVFGGVVTEWVPAEGHEWFVGLRIGLAF